MKDLSKTWEDLKNTSRGFSGVLWDDPVPERGAMTTQAVTTMAFKVRTNPWLLMREQKSWLLRPYKILDQCCLWCRGLQTVRDRQISGGDLFSSKFKANSPNWNTSGVKGKQKQRNQFKFSFEHFQDWSLEIDKVSGAMFPPTLPDLLMNFWAWKVSPDKLIFDP